MEWRTITNISAIGISLTLKGEGRVYLALLSIISLSRTPEFPEIHRNLIKIRIGFNEWNKDIIKKGSEHLDRFGVFEMDCQAEGESDTMKKSPT